LLGWKNKGDDEYLNKHLPYYGFLATIFSNSVATGQYAKSSNDPLAVEKDDTIDNDEPETYASSRPSKRAKSVVTDASGVDSLVTVIDRGTSKLADAIKVASEQCFARWVVWSCGHSSRFWAWT
jgi:hypothetical protein